MGDFCILQICHSLQPRDKARQLAYHVGVEEVDGCMSSLFTWQVEEGYFLKD